MNNYLLGAFIWTMFWTICGYIIGLRESSPEITCRHVGHAPRYRSNAVYEWVECSRCKKDITGEFKGDWSKLK